MACLVVIVSQRMKHQHMGAVLFNSSFFIMTVPNGQKLLTFSLRGTHIQKKMWRYKRTWQLLPVRGGDKSKSYSATTQPPL
jgi:hypothetical protein